MNIQDLETVLAVFNYKSWTEASYQTSQSLPNVSKRVSKVEKELGVTLFERKGKSVNTILTAYGEAVIPYIAHMVDMSSQITNYAGEMAYGKREISVGYPPLIGTVGENDILSRFRLCESDISVDHKPRQRSELINLLIQGKLDAVFMLTFDDNRGIFSAFESMLDRQISIVPIMKLEHQYIGISEKHPLAQRSSVDISELAGETFVFNNTQEYGGVEDGYIKYTFIDSSTGDCKNRIKYMDFIDSDSVLRFIADGNGVLPLNCLPPDIAPGVKFLKLYGAGRGSMAFFLHRTDKPSRAVERLLAYVQKYARERGMPDGNNRA